MGIWKGALFNFCFAFLLTELVSIILHKIAIKEYLKEQKKTNNKKKKEQTKKTFEDYIIEKYHIDLNIIGYKNFETCLNLINSCIVATAFTVVMQIKNYYIGLLIGGSIFIIMIVCLYTIMGRYYERKCINYGHKNDRK